MFLRNSYNNWANSRRSISVAQWITAFILTSVLIWNATYKEEEEWMDLLGLQNKWIRDYEPPFDTDFGMKDYENVDEDVFTPLGYKMKERSIIPALEYKDPLNCTNIFVNFLQRSQAQNESATPPKNIPWKLKGQYLLNGYTHLVETYTDEHSGDLEKTWTKDLIEGYISRDGMTIDNYDHEGKAIYFAMKEYSVENKRGMVIGTRSPWVEAIPLKLGAAHVTTVEYMKIKIKDYPKLAYKHPVQLAREYEDHVEQYDFIVSFSSLEHSGLGRYGDALDPMGDLKEAMKIHCLLKPGGLFYFGPPIGWDILHWNLHRIYGRIRLALFSAGFEIVDMFYRHEKVKIDIDWFSRPRDIEENSRKDFGQNSLWKQPVLVLRKKF